MTKMKNGSEDHADSSGSENPAIIQPKSTAALIEIQNIEADQQPYQDGECPPCHDQPADEFNMEVRELAYLKWEAAGCPAGDGFDFWLEAEREVKANRPASTSEPQ